MCEMKAKTEKRAFLFGFAALFLCGIGDWLIGYDPPGGEPLIYGSDETLYACAPSFEAAMKKYGVDYEMIVGEGMFHCYPVFPLCKEAKEGWELMIRKMKENTK